MLEISFNGFVTTYLIIITLILLLVFVFFVIIEIVMTKMENDKYIDEKNETNLKDKFYIKLDKVKYQTTSEILECLIEIDDLDKIYNQIIEGGYDFIDEMSYLKLKEDIINKIITKKINSIKPNRNKKDNLQSLIGEIEVCQKRYPKYNYVFVNKIKEIKKQLDKNKPKKKD